MLTPTELTEIERKARAYQADEAANPEAKTCHRPTPELVLRLVEEIKDWKRSCEIEEKKACDNHERADKAELDALRQHNESGMLRIERDDLAKQLKEANTHLNVATGYCQIKSKKIESLEHERDELRAKADQLREQNAGMGVELLGKDDTIKELRAKVAEKQEAWETCNRAWTLENKRFLEAEARMRELEEKIKSSGVQSAMDAGMYTDEKGTVWTAPTAWAYAMACKARDNHQQSAYEANVKSMELQAIVDRLPK